MPGSGALKELILRYKLVRLARLKTAIGIAFGEGPLHLPSRLSVVTVCKDPEMVVQPM